MTEEANEFKYVFEFTKLASDGDELYLAGYASSEAVDEHNEIMDSGSLKSVWDDFMTNPVVKFMHGMRGIKEDVGKVVPAHTDTDGKTWHTKFDHSDRPFVVVKVSDAPEHAPLRSAIREGKYTGLSLNGLAYKAIEYSKTAGRYVKRLFVQKINEVSVVDEPANRDSLYTVLKAACVGDHCGIEDGHEGQSDPIPADITIVNGDTEMGEFTKEDLIAAVRGTITDMTAERELFEKAANSDKLTAENATLKTEIETLRAEFAEFKKSIGEESGGEGDAASMRTELTDLQGKLDKLSKTPFFKAQIGQDGDAGTKPPTNVRGSHIGAIIRANYGGS